MFALRLQGLGNDGHDMFVAQHPIAVDAIDFLACGHRVVPRFFGQLHDLGGRCSTGNAEPASDDDHGDERRFLKGARQAHDAKSLGRENRSCGP